MNPALLATTRLRTHHRRIGVRHVASRTTRWINRTAPRRPLRCGDRVEAGANRSCAADGVCDRRRPFSRAKDTGVVIRPWHNRVNRFYKVRPQTTTPAAACPDRRGGTYTFEKGMKTRKAGKNQFFFGPAPTPCRGAERGQDPFGHAKSKGTQVFS